MNQLFYVIRAKKSFDDRGLKLDTWDKENPYAFKKGWYAAREFVKPFLHAKFFATHGKALAYLKSGHTLGFGLSIEMRNEYFEILPIVVEEPE